MVVLVSAAIWTVGLNVTHVLGIVNLGASATLLLRSWRSGQLQAWFKCSAKVGVALLNSRPNSVEALVKHERFYI